MELSRELYIFITKHMIKFYKNENTILKQKLNELNNYTRRKYTKKIKNKT